MELLRTFASESSIHGLAHLVPRSSGQRGNTSIHWVEKVFWLVVLLFSVLCSISLCNSHWQRFRDNATVLNVETDYLSWVFRPPAATVCSNHVTEEKLNNLLASHWQVTKEHTDYSYYRQYLQTVAEARFDSLAAFKPYANDATLVNVSVVELVRQLHLPLTPPWKTFVPVMTEVGICYSSTALYRFQAPEDANVTTANYTRERNADCYTLDVCRTMVAIPHTDAVRNLVYIHIEQDVMTGDTPISYEVREHDIVSSVLSVEQIVASRALKQLRLRRRKCRLPTEALPYFSVYTINLCRINCRIEAALRLCDCVPFFYNVGKPACKPAGLYCLAINFERWYPPATNCSCMPLCESVTYQQVSVRRKVVEQANSKLETLIIYPRMRMKRDVLFDISNLIVSFGGCAALFLGCSFISFVEIVFFVLEYLFQRLHAIYVQRQQHRRTGRL
ncbi:uncharacterized protein LOC126576749 [Anopheles aquasalis]|uniref:uncharacterized protein LOC126576749 n=1 Tax=Anopheles aquasalis TaxID=42839 RepID=UPI00215B3C86|nr:uncharacterized protein LOC126576749 [Anopheles aquasalis]